MQWNFPDLRQFETLAIDIETKDKDLKKKGPGVRRDAFVVGVALAAPGFCQYYPLRHQGGPNAPVDDVYKWLREGFARFTGEVVTANGLYDADFLTHEGGIEWPQAKWRDIQIAEAILDANRGQYKLDLLAKYYLGHGKAGTDMLANLYGADWIRIFDEIDPQLAAIYGKGDAQDTLDIWLLQRPKIYANKHHAAVMDLETRLLPMLLYMRRLGVPVDIKAADALSNKFYLEEQGIKDMIEKQTKIKPQWWAARNLAKIFDKLGIEYGKTPTGEPSITKDWLGKIDHPVAEGIERARRISKLRGTFINGYIINGHVNGRIHCEFKPTKSDTGGAITGRFSSAHPNLQNIPSRDEELAPIMRGLFRPEPGQLWCSLDWSQIEYRLLVHFAFLEKLSGAAEAVRRFRNDPKTDYHQFVMDLTGLKRKPAKKINFGRIYGMGKAKLMAALGVIEQEADEIIATYNRNIPYAGEMFKTASNRANVKGYVRTLGGRIHRFDMWESKDFETSRADGAFSLEAAIKKYGRKLAEERNIKDPDIDALGRSAIRRAWTYKALNYVIQGSAADIMKKAMIEIFEAGLTTAHGGPLGVHLTVHDELDFSMPETREGFEAYHEAKHIMETSTKLALPILADGEIGTSWGNLVDDALFWQAQEAIGAL